MLLRKFQHRIGYPVRQVPHHIFLAGKVACDAPHAQLLDLLDIRQDGRSIPSTAYRIKVSAENSPVFTNA